MDASLEALWTSYGLLPGDSVDLPTLPNSPECSDLLGDDALDPADLLNVTDPDPLVSYVSVRTTGTQTPGEADASSDAKFSSLQRQLQCEVCHDTFSTWGRMRSHLWKSHGVGRGFRCAECDFSSLNRVHVLEHMTAMHSGVSQDYRCPTCDKQFKKKTGLVAHLKFHDHDSSRIIWKCALCAVETKSRELLRKHLTNVHGKQLDGADSARRHACPHCDFRAVKLQVLRSHVARCHAGDQAASADGAEAVVPEKQFKCSICPYTAAERCDLEKHERRHNGEKPFACEYCPYRSVTRSGVLRHQRSHSQVKPHVCPECGLSYADKKRLKDHLLKHEGKKPFGCKVCGLQFRRRDNLKMHMVRRHQDGDAK